MTWNREDDNQYIEEQELGIRGLLSDPPKPKMYLVLKRYREMAPSDPWIHEGIFDDVNLAVQAAKSEMFREDDESVIYEFQLNHTYLGKCIWLSNPEGFVA
jgi:hypothetical protein